MTLLDKTPGRTPELQREQLHDEAKSGGNQPANIRAINRRQAGSAPDSVLELTAKKEPLKTSWAGNISSVDNCQPYQGFQEIPLNRQ